MLAFVYIHIREPVSNGDHVLRALRVTKVLQYITSHVIVGSLVTGNLVHNTKGLYWIVDGRFHLQCRNPIWTRVTEAAVPIAISL